MSTSPTERYEYATKTSTFLHHLDGVHLWRYRCPNEDCRSTAIVVRRRIGARKQHREWENREGNKDVAVAALRCERCPETFDAPYDSKRGVQRPVHDII